jgi:hypothetical protein
VSDHTIRSVADREQISIAAVKKQVLSNLTHGLRLASERVIETLPEASPKDALIGVGILTDKLQLLTGEATMRLEEIHHVRVNIHDDWEEFTKKLEAEAFLSAGDVTEIGPGPGIGLGGGNPEQKALPNVDAEALPETALKALAADNAQVLPRAEGGEAL